MTPAVTVAHVEDELMLLTTFRTWLEGAAPDLAVVASVTGVDRLFAEPADPTDAADGRRHVTDEWTRFLSRTPVRITARQREALRFYGVGMTYAEGGARMGIRASSFKEHIDAVRARYREAGHRVDTCAELSGQARLDGHLTEW